MKTSKLTVAVLKNKMHPEQEKKRAIFYENL